VFYKVPVIQQVSFSAIPIQSAHQNDTLARKVDFILIFFPGNPK
jgi:hypothetical protein